MSLPSPAEIAAALIARDEMPAEKGDIGPQGLDGKAGEFGPPGLRGAKGDPGRNGTNGSNGNVGPKGPQGNGGPRGLKGEKGDKGDEGERGPIGPRGLTGAVGSGKALFPRPGGGSGGGAPSGAAGGDLSGTYPNPSVLDDSHSHTAATAPGDFPPSRWTVGADGRVSFEPDGSGGTVPYTVKIAADEDPGDTTDIFNVELTTGERLFVIDSSGQIDHHLADAGSVGYTMTEGTDVPAGGTQPLLKVASQPGRAGKVTTALGEGSYDGPGTAVVDQSGHVLTVGGGGVVLRGFIAAPADVALEHGDVGLWFDQTDGAAAPQWKGKSANGTVVSGAIGGASFATPAIVLGTAAAAGSASTVIRSDSTIVAFDATTPAAVGTAAVGAAAVASRRDHVHATGAGTPSTQAFGDAAATGSGPAAAMTDHKHAMPAAPATVVASADLLYLIANYR